MGNARQNAQQIFGDGNCGQPRQGVSIDRVEQQDPAGTQGSRYLSQDLVQICDMFQHIDTDYGVKAGVCIWQAFTHAHIISNAQATLERVGACRIDRLRGGVEFDRTVAEAGMVAFLDSGKVIPFRR